MGTLNPGGRAITAATRLLGTELQCVPLLGVGEQMAGEQEAWHSCVPGAREDMLHAQPSCSFPEGFMSRETSLPVIPGFLLESHV